MNENSLALTQTALIFVTLLPDVRDIRNHTDAEFAKDTRVALYAAVGLALGVGVGLTMISKTPGPLLVTALTAALLAAATEYLITTN